LRSYVASCPRSFRWRLGLSRSLRRFLHVVVVHYISYIFFLLLRTFALRLSLSRSIESLLFLFVSHHSPLITIRRKCQHFSSPLWYTQLIVESDPFRVFQRNSTRNGNPRRLFQRSMSTPISSTMPLDQTIKLDVWRNVLENRVRMTRMKHHS